MSPEKFERSIAQAAQREMAKQRDTKNRDTQNVHNQQYEQPHERALSSSIPESDVLRDRLIALNQEIIKLQTESSLFGKGDEAGMRIRQRLKEMIKEREEMRAKMPSQILRDVDEIDMLERKIHLPEEVKWVETVPRELTPLERIDSVVGSAFRRSDFKLRSAEDYLNESIATDGIINKLVRMIMGPHAYSIDIAKQMCQDAVDHLEESIRIETGSDSDKGRMLKEIQKQIRTLMRKDKWNRRDVEDTMARMEQIRSDLEQKTKEILEAHVGNIDTPMSGEKSEEEALS